MIRLLMRHGKSLPIRAETPHLLRTDSSEKVSSLSPECPREADKKGRPGMPKASLEIKRLEINSIRERWRTYFTLAVSPSFSSNETAIIVLPDFPILFTGKTNNKWSFVPKGEGADGLLAFCDDIELDSYKRIGLWIHNSRDLTRTAGEVLQNVSKVLGTVPSLVPQGMSSTALWAMAPTAGISAIGAILESLGDRDLGYVNMDERFGLEFHSPGVIERSQTCSSGLITLDWKWVVQ
jgi:hypothetical protein